MLVHLLVALSGTAHAIDRVGVGEIDRTVLQGELREAALTARTSMSDWRLRRVAERASRGDRSALDALETLGDWVRMGDLLAAMPPKPGPVPVRLQQCQDIFGAETGTWQDVWASRYTNISQPLVPDCVADQGDVEETVCGDGANLVSFWVDDRPGELFYLDGADARVDLWLMAQEARRALALDAANAQVATDGGLRNAYVCLPRSLDPANLRLGVE